MGDPYVMGIQLLDAIASLLTRTRIANIVFGDQNGICFIHCDFLLLFKTTLKHFMSKLHSPVVSECRKLPEANIWWWPRRQSISCAVPSPAVWSPTQTRRPIRTETSVNYRNSYRCSWKPDRTDPGQPLKSEVTNVMWTFSVGFKVNLHSLLG